jgi:pimeloyl-ACP methyl ester carboxylesterase
MRILLAFVAVFLLPAVASAQVPRYEAGQRLRSFERALEKHSSADARKRALEPLKAVTPTFLCGQLSEVGALLDQARRALLSDSKPDDAVVWADSLSGSPATRLLDPTAGTLEVTLDRFYKAGKAPADPRVRWALVSAAGKALAPAVTQDVGELPVKGKLELKGVPEGDHRLRVEILAGGKVLVAREQTVSAASKLAERLAALKKGVTGLKVKEPTTESATLGKLMRLLGELEDKKTLETDYPAARLLKEGEEVLKAIQAGQRYYTPGRAGQFWLSLVSGSTTDPVRVQIPAQAAKARALPLVVAMHGAGASENLFFDGYGGGLAARLCAERGWLLVTTRTSLVPLAKRPDVVRVVAALAKVYPVDTKKVFLVGHSMGAGQSVTAAVRSPKRFAAVAALGGGGAVRQSAGLDALPFFVGVGEQDFLQNPARTLAVNLAKAGVKKVVYRRYEDVEHLAVVQLALPEVFKFFDEAAKAR